MTGRLHHRPDNGVDSSRDTDTGTGVGGTSTGTGGTGRPRLRGAAPRVDVLAAGVVFADLVFEDVCVPGPGQESFARAFGFSPGAAANQAVAAARLGSRTALVSSVGDDAMGHLVRDWLGGIENLDLRWLATRAGLTTPVSAALSHDGDRSFVSYLDASLVDCPDDSLRALGSVGTVGPAKGGAVLPAVGAVNVGVSAEPPGWVQDLAHAGTRVVMSTAWDPTQTWDTAVLDGLSMASAFILNEVEALALTRRPTARRAAEHLLARVPTVVVTSGREGAIACDRSCPEPVEVPGLPVPVRDPTGAGDVFIGAWLSTEDSGLALHERVLLSVAASGLSVRGLGGAASAPTTRQILEHVRSHQTGHDFATIEQWLAGRPVRPDAGSTERSTT